MSKFNHQLVDEIAKSCLKLYNKLPKTGKPIVNEWTVLSCIIQYDNSNEKFEVVSLGTGSKCIGASKMTASGDVLNDSHAEVFARRAFLLYLYDNIDQVLDSKQSIFIYEDGKLTLKDNIEFLFYSSQLPCGDGSILPKNGVQEDFGDMLHSLKIPSSEDICDSEFKKKKRESGDIYRTGAKCLPKSKQDSRLPGTNYHVIGQVRTKPGRGDRTLSVSCSDKLARWVHVGIQGGLLNLLLNKPVFIHHFIFGAGVPYSIESLTRALLRRNNNESMDLLDIVPQFHQCSLAFPQIRTEVNVRPAPGSIVWNKLKLEVAVQGKKLGVTKKQAKSLSSSLCISKYNIYTRFLQVLDKDKQFKKCIDVENNLQSTPYSEMKRMSKRYIEKWNLVKERFFKTWTKKPDIWNFCINESIKIV